MSSPSTTFEDGSGSPAAVGAVGKDILVLTNGDRPGKAASTTRLRRDSSTTTHHDAVSGRARVTKRNKPTLNCLECVERKSKCDRVRPSCFTCIRRQTPCQYTHVANAIAASSSQNGPRKRPWSDHDPNQLTRSEDNASTNPAHLGNIATSSMSMNGENGDLDFRQDFVTGGTSDEIDQILNMTPLFTNAIETFAPLEIPSPPSCAQNERHALLNLFGNASAEHPFQNYWTDMGGLVEIVTSLPSRLEADRLIERYFETVDAVYPLIHRHAFIGDVERFRQLCDSDKHRHDPAQIALQFAVYANAMHDTSLQEGNEVQMNTAAFYLSCCHQTLCVSNYLNRCSLLTIQTMILICHFMIASNRTADAWTISGIVQRQIYGLKLNRSCKDLGLDIDADNVQIRLRLWQAAMLQDAQLSLRLRRPPSTTYFDVTHLDVQPFTGSTPDTACDVAYVRAMWQCSALIQETICSPQSNEQPLVADATRRSHLIARYQALYSQFDQPFCQTASSRFDHLSPRVLYQMVTITTTYFHALMLLYIEKNERAGVHSDPHSAVRAAREGMTAFFALLRISPGHIRNWAAAHNRVYNMAIVIGTMLVIHKNNRVATKRAIADEPQLMLGKSDLDRYISVLGRARGSMEFRVCQRERLANLKTLQAAVQEE
ncbi:hypothetical protein DOTSEDRAFT_71554 [Dothistroma septosporum NZE10]|uniref:Zn(2)-C6 fungal-type domain-containing protein n=1 Tax=Dothistroma septosporum (strain NZE10 / CBS 128990) TaxID=675120 RepID=N1PJR0_DOTSN|nr:hypothetical protein DOTSEDRAFT_71554 [Dothistroma septosporum NZE10]